MKKPGVFVSSTCYDLKQLRTDMKDFIESLGLDPLLSEFNSFPINPDSGTVDNCLSVVEKKADIFVLIVGQRYGSVTDTGRSITNLEFLAARAKGIPVYAFVMRPVLDVLAVWKTNPEANFSNVTDSPKLFEFVASLKEGGGTWLFPFDVAAEIFDVLRNQLACLFMESLELRTKIKGSGGLSERFRNLSGSLLRLIIERPRGWEYLLFSEALESELKRLEDLKRDWQYGIALGKGEAMTPSQFCGWIPSKIEDALRSVANAKKVIDGALPIAFGPLGTSGDPERILHAANRLADTYRTALEWKLDFLRIALPQEMTKLQGIVGCFLDNVIVDIEKFSRTLADSLPSAIQATLAGQKVNLTFTLELTTPELPEFELELSRIASLIECGALRPG